MKKIRLFIVPLMVTLLLGITDLIAQDVITGGNMENAADWTAIWRTDTEDPGDTIIFNYTDSVPALGSGGCLRITGFGQAGAYVFQEVTLSPRHRYSMNAAFANISSDTIANTWVEIILSKTAPVASADYGPGDGEYRASMNTWFAADTLNYDGLISDRFEFNENTANQLDFSLPDTGTTTTWYFVIKTGCWNDAGQPPAFDFLFDSVSLIDLGVDSKLPIKNVVVGSVDNADDFSATVDITWDADSVYMVYDVVDDSIVNAGTAYQVDNIEIYFDMDNSKNVHYPRNGGWVASVDDAYDTNDFQLRLVPDSAFSVNNSARPDGASISGGYRQVYTRTADGYQFIMNIAWDSLMDGFDASEGTTIGFDVLISDNDSVASDAARNQITWNSPTDKPFNDPSLFGTLELISENNFLVIPDEEAPTVPSNVATSVEAGEVTVTWDASTDNIAVLYYAVLQDNQIVATVYPTAADASGSYTTDSLDNGTYSFIVRAFDNSGNSASSSAVDAVVDEGPEAVNETLTTFTSIYPNPTDGMVNVITDAATPVTVEVYTASGSLVVTDTFRNNYSLDLSGVSKGMYFIKLTSGDMVQVEKVIVK